MIRRPPRSTLSSSSAASDVYKRQGQLSRCQLGVIGQAVSRLSWHREVAGQVDTGTPVGAGHHRLSETGLMFPRTDPVAIMLVQSKDGERCLLGQTKRRHSSHMYSCLAGFVEQCESVEDAVRRETMEESGIQVGAVSYTHLRAHETPEHLVCRLLLEKKKKNNYNVRITTKTIKIDK
eukprot:TRINITY_DN60060_c0_g1_i1.p1 TRINITY_DN60060_c0_g1~~TRINITY_DN60060_c0_g1_i1.p1  ORF type:complete len:178 (-),score=50.92 TRINITY_DN60060_c0_g1_i1:16-549(-)